MIIRTRIRTTNVIKTIAKNLTYITFVKAHKPKRQSKIRFRFSQYKRDI